MTYDPFLLIEVTMRVGLHFILGQLWNARPIYFQPSNVNRLESMHVNHVCFLFVVSSHPIQQYRNS